MDPIESLFAGAVTRREILKRGGASGLGLALGGSLLAACGGDDDDEESGAPGAGEPVVLWTSHTNPDLATLRTMVDGYNATRPPGRVKLVSVTGDETDIAKLTAAVRGGKGPDIYMLDRFTVAQRAEQGILLELTEFMEQDEGVGSYKDRYLDFAWAEVEFEGKPYALPFDTDARGLWYNAQLLRKAKVDPAELDPDNGPVTVDRLREIARMLDVTDDSGQYSQVGFIPWYDQGWHFTWGFAFGGEFFDEGSCEVTPTNDGVIAGLQFVQDWANEMDPEKAQSFLATVAQCTGPMTCPPTAPQQWPFITQKLAMVVTGDWPIKWVSEFAKDLDYGVTFIPVPTEGAESATWAGGWSLVIPTGAKNPEGAWKLMQWFAGTEGQRRYSVGTAHLPTLKELVDDDSLFDEQHQFFRELLDVARNRPPLPVGALYWDELTVAQEAVVLNRKSPADALEQVASRVQPQLQEFCPLEVA
jgi:multiple sugar transport system substrate-binding protein